MALEHFKTQVLLLHSQQSTLDALGAGFNDRYAVHFATSGSEALTTLSETPIHIIVSAQDLPGMSGLEALREARKRSPDMVGILLAGDSDEQDIEALVGEKEVFQIVRGAISPNELFKLVENAARRIRMLTISESANDNEAEKAPAANTGSRFDTDAFSQEGEHIIMETMENGASMITDATGSMPALTPDTVDAAADAGNRTVDVLVLSKDEEFIATIRASARNLHQVHHAFTAQQAQEIVASNSVGVLVTDAAIAGNKIALLTQKLRAHAPRLVAIVAGRRDDGESLMELINQGQVYRFLLKPVSPGRARLAVEASARYHVDAPESAFQGRGPAQDDTAAVSGAQPDPPDPRQPDEPPPADAATAIRAEDPLASTDKLRKLPQPASAKTEQESAAGSALPKIAAGIGVLMLLAAGGYFFLSQPASEPAATLPAAAPAPVAAPGDVVVDENLPAYLALLDNARFARDTGRLLTPAGDNALEWYIEARLAAPDNVIVRDELAALVDQVIGMAEAALLESRVSDVESILQMVRLADPENSRLNFLSAQLYQRRLQATLDEARAAIRGDRFEDAGRFLATAITIPGANLEVIDQLTEDLAIARSAQRLDDVLALANARLAEDQLISPPNDSARYFFELAANNAPDNVAAQQGLLVVASKLVLKARAAIDSGDFEAAGLLLEDARALNPESPELQTTERALQKSLELQANAERRASTARQSGATDSSGRQAADERRRAAASATLSNADRDTAETSEAGDSAEFSPASVDTGDLVPEAPAAEAIAADATAADASSAGELSAAGPIATTPTEPEAIGQVAISKLTRSNYVAPRYPRNAQRRNVTGWVDIGFTVTPDGGVADIEIIDSRPGTVFDKSAQEAAAQWRFEPVIENGRAVSKRVAVRMAFSLE